MTFRALLLLLLLPVIGAAQTTADNARLDEMFRVDQAARQGANIDWTKLRVEDEQRLNEVRSMLGSGAIRSANDYFQAALIFQHGRAAEDFLMAHILAGTSVSMGRQNARWLAAASLDRYLLTIGKPQVFGTQYLPKPGGDTIRREMDTTLVPDSVREANCVISEEEQKNNLEQMTAGRPLRRTITEACR